jgi:hypothetical protein
VSAFIAPWTSISARNSVSVVGLDRRGAIVPRQKWSRGQIETRLAAMPLCLIGMESLCRRTSPQPQALRHDARLMLAKWARV